MQLDPRTGVPSRGQQVLLTQRIASPSRALRAGSASHPCDTLETNLVLISPSRLDEDSWSLSEHQLGTFARNRSPESRPPPRFLPREPPGQAMAIVRG